MTDRTRESSVNAENRSETGLPPNSASVHDLGNSPATPSEAGESPETVSFASVSRVENDPYATRPSTMSGNGGLAAGSDGAIPSHVTPRMVIPGYEVLGELGRGGMGVVYKARQVRLNRTVALKMILGSAHVNDETLARFQREAEAVAQVQHPNIVQIYEIGDHNGLPYFSLEFVDCGSLDRLAAGQQFPSRDVAGLVETIARAMHYAHERGIIHRDLKPANILMQSVESGGSKHGVEGRGSRVAGQNQTPDAQASTVNQQQPSTFNEQRSPGLQPSTFNLQLFVPKITDFGLAKQLEGDATATRSGAVMGTPSYMAPEQAAGRTREIGPLADVYALGAILYNLLTGRPPFRAESVMDTLRLVIESDPISPRLLNPTLDRDLETICLKCLEKDPQRRYPSAQSLASDLLRYRTGMAIEARPIGPVERTWRWSRRFPGAASAMVATCAAILILAVSLSVITGKNQALAASNTQLNTANMQLDEKNIELTELYQKEHDARAQADEQREAAEHSATTSRAVINFFQNKVLAIARPKGWDGGLGVNVTVREALDTAEPEIKTAFTDLPLAEGVIRGVLGNTYNLLGEAARAVAQQERAYNLLETYAGPQHEWTLRAMGDLAFAHKRDGEYKRSLQLHERVFELRKDILGPEHADTLVSMNNLAALYQELGMFNQARSVLEQALDTSVSQRGKEAKDSITLMAQLVRVELGMGNVERAAHLAGDAVRLSEAHLATDDPVALASKNSRAFVYLEQGAVQEAIAIWKELVSVSRETMGADHPQTLVSLANLGLGYCSARDWNNAQPLLEETLRLMKGRPNADHPDSIAVMGSLAACYQRTDNPSGALVLLEEAVGLAKQKLGPDNHHTLGMMNNLAVLLQFLQRTDEAVQLFEEVLRASRTKPGSTRPELLTLLGNLASAYRRTGRPSEAVPLYEELLALRTQLQGAQHSDTIGTMSLLASALLEIGKTERALTLIDRYVSLRRSQSPPDDPRFAQMLAVLSTDLLKHQQYRAAEPILRECVAICERVLPDEWPLFHAKTLLGAALAGQKKFEEAEPLLVEGYSGMKDREATIPPGAQPRLTEAARRLVDLYTAWDKPEEAMKWQAVLDEPKSTENM